MKPTDLRSYLKVIKEKESTGKEMTYQFYVNTYSFKILRAIRDMGLIKLTRKKGGRVSVESQDLLDIVVYKYPQGFKLQNYPKVKRVFLENNSYATLLISTSLKGIISLQRAKDLNIGGTIVAKIVGSKPLLELA